MSVGRDFNTNFKINCRILQQDFDFLKMGDQHKHFDSEFYYSGQLTDEDLLLLRKHRERVLKST